MQALKDRLANLDPPVKSLIRQVGSDEILITLIDPTIPAKVERKIRARYARNADLLYVIVRDAVDSLKRQGGHEVLGPEELQPE